MIVTCESCKARYKLDDSKVTGRGARITCPKCRHVFVVYAQASAETPSSPSWTPPGARSREVIDEEEPTRIGMPGTPTRPSPATTLHFGAGGGVAQVPMTNGRANPTLAVPLPDPPAPDTHVIGGGSRAPGPTPTFGNTVSPVTSPGEAAARASALDFRKVGVSTWKVKVRIGLIYDFSDIKTLRKYIQDGRVTPADVISYDGKNWKPIGEISDLDAFFVETYERLSRERAAVPEAVNGTLPTPQVAPTPLAGVKEPVPSTFRDPFDDLKDRQRDRLSVKRTGTITPTRPRRAVAWIVAVLLLLVATPVGGYFLWQSVQPKPSGGTIAQPSPATPKVVDDIRAKIQDDLARQAETLPGTPKPVAPYDQLIPIGPRGVVGVPPGAVPVPPRDGATKTVSTPVTPSIKTYEPSASDHEAAGDGAAKSGNWSQAVTGYKNAAEANPGSAALLLKLGNAQYRAGDPDGAMATLQQAADKGQKSALKTLGAIARDNGDVAGANLYYQQYLASSPKDAAEIERIVAEMNGG